MEITLYRYKMYGVSWSSDSINSNILEKMRNTMMEAPFKGLKDEDKYGFAHCTIHSDHLIGLFIQKYAKQVKDYNVETKEEQVNKTIDSGEHLFVMNLHENEVYLQARRVSELPKRQIILKRFKDFLFSSLSDLSLSFIELKETSDETDREKIVKVFYEESDRVIEMNFSGFDHHFVIEQRKRRNGTVQRYFNPKEDYNEAMEEASITFGKHAQKSIVKAKPGEDLKRDPLTRAQLEASKKPTKMIYLKNNKKYSLTSEKKRKVVVALDGDGFELEKPERVETILRSVSIRPIELNNGEKTDNKGQLYFKLDIDDE